MATFCPTRACCAQPRVRIGGAFCRAQRPAPCTVRLACVTTRGHLVSRARCGQRARCACRLGTMLDNAALAPPCVDMAHERRSGVELPRLHKLSSFPQLPCPGRVPGVPDTTQAPYVRCDGRWRRCTGTPAHPQGESPHPQAYSRPQRRLRARRRRTGRLLARRSDTRMSFAWPRVPRAGRALVARKMGRQANAIRREAQTSGSGD